LCHKKSFSLISEPSFTGFTIKVNIVNVATMLAIKATVNNKLLIIHNRYSDGFAQQKVHHRLQ
jgi:hypothetical protein